MIVFFDSDVHENIQSTEYLSGEHTREEILIILGRNFVKYMYFQ